MRVDSFEIIGETYITNEGYEIQIIDYIDRSNVLIKFIKFPDYQVWSTMQNIRNGQIKNPYHKSVYNRGFYGVGRHKARNNNIKTEQYVKWFSMFDRCYNPKVHEKMPEYIDCEVSDEFCNFQNFAEWYDRKIYTSNYKLELDKDLLVRWNKIYSPRTCCFIPKEINNNLNYTRDNKEYMNYLYQKYKKELPDYIVRKLYALSKGVEKL